MKHFSGIYFRQQKKHILTYLLFCSIFSVIIILYQLPATAVLYPILLCTIAGVVIMGIDMFQTWRRYAALQQTLDAVGLELDQEIMPEKKYEGSSRTADSEGCAWELLQEILNGMKEEDLERGGWEAGVYREMVGRLLLEQRRRQDIMQIRHQDTVDYYTTWVHQIKTPIAAMGLILQQEDTEDSRRLSEELQRIEQYVDMVLTYLRLDSKETDYVFARVDLDKLVCGCIKKYAGQFIRRHMTLNYQSMDCQVLTDEKWLAFVVEQVLSNALKYTREGSVSIYLEHPCVLCIRDTGIGIAPEDLPRIFEKGYTGYNGRSDKKATGLGLYLCRQICNRLKSTITAESVPGEGTTIRIGLAREVLEVE